MTTKFHFPERENVARLLRKYGEFILLAGIVAAAFLVRYIGLKFGYPFLTHPDESTILNAVVSMTANRTLDAGFPMRPDLFLIHTNFVVLNAVSFLKFGASIAQTYAARPLFFYYTARLGVVLIGSLTPILAWKIGKEGKLDFSLPAAIFFAFYPAYVEHSHYVTPDVPITFFTLFILLFSIKYAKTGSMKYLYLATFVAALNTSEKYPGLISFGIVAAAILLREFAAADRPYRARFKRASGQVFKFGLIFLLCLFFLAPTLFIEYGRTFDAIVNEARTTHLGADHLGWAGNMAFYAREFLHRGNWLLVLMAIPGVGYAIKQRDRVFLFAAYGALYWVILSRLALHWERWALPMYSAPLLFAACGAASPAYFLRRFPRAGNSLRWGAIGVVGLGLFLASFSQSIEMTYRDTRVAGLEYCNQNGITPDNTLFETYTPFSPTLEQGSDFHARVQSGVEMEHVILSSSMYERYYSEPERYSQEVADYEKIKRDYRIVAEFSPYSNGHDNLAEQLDAIAYYVRRHWGEKALPRLSGPVIRVYEKN